MPTITRVTMPQLGESVHEGTISRWLVKPGDKVEEFEPLLEVDTDKVNAEVPSPVSGVLREILAGEGQTVEAGAEIAVVEIGEKGAAPASAPLATESAHQATPAEVGPAEVSTAQPEAGVERGPDEGHRYSPAVLMLARERNVDLAQVVGSGIGGRVTKRDVRDFLDQRSTAPASPSSSAARPAVDQPGTQEAKPPAGKGEGDQSVPLSRIRRLIAANMVQSKTSIPHAWQTQEVDMSGVVANRAAHKRSFGEREGFSLTYLPYVVAAAAAALREHPEVNATFGGEEIVIHRQVNVGISVGLEDTLIVPVIKDADGLSLTGIARAVDGLASRARAKKIGADDLAGGTFTVNNSGTFGTLFSYSVINPGQAGILTMEAIVERPVAVNGMIGIRPMMYLCFSFDHRALDGLQAARFLTSCRKWLETVTAETSLS